MANNKEKDRGQTRILVFDSDRLRLRKIADDERRRMMDMISIMIDFWEKHHS